MGTDAESDLAILKFDPGDKELTTIPLGTSEGLRPGQKVLAIGNPFGLERTLTTGVVSGLGRPIKTEEGLIIQNMIQTDASINPGNSGGPLINSRGQMIGINTSIYSTAGGSIGIGFAVPVDMARRVVPELMEYGKVIRGWIDIRVIPLDARIAEYAQLPIDSGILIQQIGSGGNAEQAGLRGGNLDEPVYYGRDILYLGGDILIEIDGHPIATVADFYASLEESKPGQEVDVVYIRKGRKQRTKLILSERK